MGNQLDAEAPDNTQQAQESNINAPGGICSSDSRAAEIPSSTTRGHCCNHVGKFLSLYQAGNAVQSS